jgi:predicted DNA-binding transcriptional regulator YafY
MRKVVDALPQGHRASLESAARRFLVEPEFDLLSRRRVSENLPEGVMSAVRRAVLTGRRLRFDYAAPGKTPTLRVVDPIGLVTVRGSTYLLATTSGNDRTYRLSRMLSADMLPDPAQRLAQVDLDRIWAERCAQFLSADHIPVVVRVRASRRDELLEAARAVRAEAVEPDDWIRLDVTFEDLRHAVWAVWQLDTDAEVLAPDSLRAALRDRATALLGRYVG